MKKEELSSEQREEVRKIVREEIKKPTCKACQLQRLPRLLRRKFKSHFKNPAMSLEQALCQRISIGGNRND